MTETPVDAAVLADWWERVGRRLTGINVAVADDRVELRGSGNDISVPEWPPAPVHVFPGSGVVRIVFTNPADVAAIHADLAGGGTLRLQGEAVVARLDAIGHGLLIIERGTVCNHVDLSHTDAATELRSEDSGGIREVVVPAGRPMKYQLAGPIELLHVGGERLRIEGRVVTQRLTIDGETLYFDDGQLEVTESCPQRLSMHNTRVTLSSGVFANLYADVDSGGTLHVTGRATRVERLTAVGRGDVLIEAGARVLDASFGPGEGDTDGDGPNVAVTAASELSEARGRFRVQCRGGSSVMGTADEGVDLTSVIADADASIEGIDFFRLRPTLLVPLRDARRLTGSWPRRREAANRAALIDAGVTTVRHRPAARAHYWANVERLLEDAGAGGEDLVMAHYLAQHTRLLATTGRDPACEPAHGRWRTFTSWLTRPWSTERVLLEVSRSTGYATRVGWPIALWGLLACLFAVAIHGAAGEGFVGSPGRGLNLAWDVFTSPFSWARPVSLTGGLNALATGHLPASALAFLGRLVGSFALVSSALAVRRHLRNR